MKDKHSQRESNYGRDFGWYAESLDGVRLAELTDPRFEDMFWTSYHVAPLGEPARICSPDFWYDPTLQFRNRGTGQLASNAFAGGVIPTPEQPRVWMRALYVDTQA